MHAAVNDLSLGVQDEVDERTLVLHVLHLLEPKAFLKALLAVWSNRRSGKRILQVIRTQARRRGTILGALQCQSTTLVVLVIRMRRNVPMV